MKKHDNIAVTGVVALLALIGAVKVAQTACALTAQMGTTAKRVTQQYPDGWSGRGRGKTIRLDTLLDQEFNCY